MHFLVRKLLYFDLNLIWLYSLSYWGPVAHICVSKLTNIGSDNGLSPGRCQAIIWTIAGILLIGPLGTIFSEILIEISTFPFTKMHLNVLSAKWWPFCLGLNVVRFNWKCQHCVGNDVVPGHYLKQWWSSSMMTLSFTRPQWVNTAWPFHDAHFINFLTKLLFLSHPDLPGMTSCLIQVPMLSALYATDSQYNFHNNISYLFNWWPSPVDYLIRDWSV